MRRPEFVAQHARHPHGLVGRLLAKITSLETRAINRATLRALGLRPTDRVLEVGCGRGRTVAQAAQVVSAGKVTGIDHAEAVIHAARRRCRRWIESGRVVLEVADSAQLPFADGAFDKAYAVHTIYFWTAPATHLRELRRVLAPGGRLALAARTKSNGLAPSDFPDSIYTFYDLDQITAMLRSTGFGAPEIIAAPGGSDLAIVVAPAALTPTRS